MAERYVLNADELRQLLVYHPETGIMRWQARPASFWAHLSAEKAKVKAASFNRRKAGQEAGGLAPQGYRLICLTGAPHPAHRIAWCMYYGDWPTGIIDHIDGNRSNNAIGNLRAVTHAVNLRNREYNPRGSSGVTGVYPNGKGRWLARLYLKDRAPHFGTFDTVEEAEAVIAIARKALGFNDRK